MILHFVIILTALLKDFPMFDLSFFKDLISVSITLSAIFKKFLFFI